MKNKTNIVFLFLYYLLLPINFCLGSYVTKATKIPKQRPTVIGKGKFEPTTMPGKNTSEYGFPTEYNIKAPTQTTTPTPISQPNVLKPTISPTKPYPSWQQSSTLGKAKPIEFETNVTKSQQNKKIIAANKNLLNQKNHFLALIKQAKNSAWIKNEENQKELTNKESIVVKNIDEIKNDTQYFKLEQAQAIEQFFKTLEEELEREAEYKKYPGPTEADFEIDETILVPEKKEKPTKQKVEKKELNAYTKQVKANEKLLEKKDEFLELINQAEESKWFNDNKQNQDSLGKNELLLDKVKKTNPTALTSKQVKKIESFFEELKLTLEKEQKERLELEQIEKELAEITRKEKEREAQALAEQQAKEQAQREAQERAERLERERLEELKRLEQEKLEAQRLAELEHLEIERLERELAEQKEQEARRLQEQQEREAQELAERIEKEHLELEHLEQKRLEAQRLAELERLELERIKKEKLEAEQRIKLEEQTKAEEQARLEQEAKDRELTEQQEREPLEREKLTEQERLKNEQLEREAQEKAKLEAEQQAKLKAEEQAKAEELARLERERLEQQKREAQEKALAEQKEQEAKRLQEEREILEQTERLEKERLQQETQQHAEQQAKELAEQQERELREQEAKENEEREKKERQEQEKREQDKKKEQIKNESGGDSPQIKEAIEEEKEPLQPIGQTVPERKQEIKTKPLITLKDKEFKEAEQETILYTKPQSTIATTTKADEIIYEIPDQALEIEQPISSNGIKLPSTFNSAGSQGSTKRNTGKASMGTRSQKSPSSNTSSISGNQKYSPWSLANTAQSSSSQRYADRITILPTYKEKEKTSPVKTEKITTVQPKDTVWWEKLLPKWVVEYLGRKDKTVKEAETPVEVATQEPETASETEKPVMKKEKTIITTIIDAIKKPFTNAMDYIKRWFKA